jgi:parallel beta-helix repeat protein
MNKHRFILSFGLLTFMMLTPLYADTIPGGDVSGTWYAANSPYYITGDITIPADSTLTIEPGVEVEFQGNYSLVVNGGYLEAIGTEVDSIHFFPADTNARWDGIGFSSAPDSSHMDYCTVQYATYDELRGGGGIDCSNSNPVISHCAISHCDGLWGGGIYFNNFNGSISYCTIIGNQSLLWGGGIYLNNSSLLLSYCTISDNSAFEAGGTYGNNSNQIFLDCIISGNTSTEKAGGIYISDGSQSLTGCEISDNYADMGGGIYFVNASATLTSCAF